MNERKNQNLWAFDNLPAEIKSWLRSESVTKIIEEINKKFGFSGEKLKIIPFMATWIAIKTINPEEFIKTAMIEFQLSLKESQSLAEIMLGRIFNPVKAGLKSSLGIDVERVREYQPEREILSAKEMKMERVPPRTVNLRGVASHGGETEPKQPQAVNRAPAKTPSNPESADKPFHLTEQTPTAEGKELDKPAI